jgi:hypothetical protein
VVIKTKKEVVELWLRDVPPDKVFWFRDGRMVKNLDELDTTLGEMPEETFYCHVTGGKNDFSNWVSDVVGDVTLANQFQKATTQAATARRVETRLNWIETRL